MCAFCMSAVSQRQAKSMHENESSTWRPLYLQVCGYAVYGTISAIVDTIVTTRLAAAAFHTALDHEMWCEECVTPLQIALRM